MTPNKIYCSDTCPFCQRAYQLLERKNIPFKKYQVKTAADWDEVLELTNRNTVPQIFINGVHIGGFDDLSAADSSGQLDKILAQ
jgi:glutaredoxin 3